MISSPQASSMADQRMAVSAGPIGDGREEGSGERRGGGGGGGRRREEVLGIFDPRSVTATKRSKRLSIYPLIALIFYEVSGGPFGVEDSVQAGGPLLAIVGFLVFPFLWSVPEALVTAELATAMPENGGYVVWIASAFGPFWGFQEGFWKWLSGAMDNALYPVLFLDYLKHSIPALSGGTPRTVTLLGLTVLLTLLNYRGLTIVGYTAIALCAFSLSPFVVLSLLSIPKIRPQRWLVADLKHTDWRGYANSLFWNLNFWDKASTMAGEVDKPRETFPKALFAAVLLVVVSYVVPLLAGTGAFPLAKNNWDDGYFAEVAAIIGGGAWLKWWIQAAAGMSNMGLFEAEMSSDSFQLLGMSEMGLLPKFFSYRSRYGTPTFSILCSAIGVVGLSWMDFDQIIELVNFLYSMGMLLEFAAFIWLRIKKPDLPRPFKIPVNTFFSVLMCIVPSGFLIVVMCLASLRTLFVSLGAAVVGLLLYPGILHLKKKKWLKFHEGREPLPSMPLQEEVVAPSTYEQDGLLTNRTSRTIPMETQSPNHSSNQGAATNPF